LQAQQAQPHIAAVTHGDLRWADGIAWGTPTRYGNMSAQHGWPLARRRTRGQGHRDFHKHRSHSQGQETTILTALVPLIHLGMVFVGTPYGQDPQLFVTDSIGGSPYGPGTLAGADGSRQPVEAEFTAARNLGY
jgi:NAD(P)H dehydrogenase (quinone)